MKILIQQLLTSAIDQLQKENFLPQEISYSPIIEKHAHQNMAI